MNKDDTSNIFQDLAALNGAGIAMLEAAQIVGSSHSGITAWPDVVHRLARGSTLVPLLFKTRKILSRVASIPEESTISAL